MAKFIINLQASLRPFVFASAFSLLLPSLVSAQPKSECNQLTDASQCANLKSGDVNLCKWVDMTDRYTVKGQRKSYCRTSTASITKAQFEAMQAARAGSSTPVVSAR